MDICNICHQPLYRNQLVKRYHGAYSWYGEMNKAHLDCYRKFIKYSWLFLPEFWIGVIGGIVMIILGAMGASDPSIFETSDSPWIAVLVVGIVIFIIGAISGIVFLVKFFSIRKNPGEHLTDGSNPNGPVKL